MEGVPATFLIGRAPAYENPRDSHVAGVFLCRFTIGTLVGALLRIRLPGQSVKVNSRVAGGMQTWSSQHCHVTLHFTSPFPDPESGRLKVFSPS